MADKMRRWIPIWVYPVLLLLAIGTVWLRLLIVDTTYNISQATKSIRSLQQDREQIELRVAGLRSPRRLESLARGKYGLTQPKSDQVVYIRSQSIPRR